MKKKMTVKQVEDIMRRIAVENETTLEEVKKEIKLAMMSGIKNESPEVQKRWSEISHNAESLTPEEFVIYLASRIQEGKN